MTEKKNYTLITGASRGIGMAFAKEFARRKSPLALVALPNEQLEELANQLSTEYSVPVKYLEIDLAQAGATKKVFDWTQSNAIDVHTLVNNAGFGQMGSFLDYEMGFYQSMVNLNTEATCGLIHSFLPKMKQRNEGYILNVASAAAFFPLPYKSVYAGTKAFLYYISRALQYELKDSNVHLSVVCPNGVPTNEATRQRVKALGRVGKWIALEPEEVAKTSIKGLLRRKKVIIPGAMNKLAYYLSLVTPISTSMKLAGRKMERESN